MSVRIYLDTNIYLDYCEKRSDGIRPLQELAFSIFRRTLECEFEIAISNFVIKEIKNSKSSKEAKIIMDCLFSELKAKKKVVYFEEKYEEVSRAKSYENWKDALHAIVARRVKCTCIVTRNISDFLEFSDILEPKLPEQL